MATLQKPPVAAHRTSPARPAAAFSALCVLLGAALTTTTQATCKSPLPDAQYQALDRYADTDPQRTIESARRKLDALAPNASAAAAQLYAIIADANDTLNDDDAARRAVAAARRHLDQLPLNATYDSLRLRLLLTEADTAETRPELTAALVRLSSAEHSLRERTLDHACLLLVRGRLQGRLNQHDLAAIDVVAAYRIATSLAQPDAAAEAAYQLATTYRRAGLYPDALRAVEEAIAYTRGNGQTAMLALSLYVKSQVLAEMGKPAAALAASRESRALSVGLRDSIGIAFADSEQCGELLALNEPLEAERTCLAAAAGWRAGARLDQMPATQSLLARIDLLRGRNREALQRLNGALERVDDRVPPTFRSRLYRDRAEALSRLGRTSEALRDTREAARLSAENDDRQRSLAVAVMGAQLDAERTEREKRELEAQLAVERQRTESQRSQSRLSLVLAAAATGIVLLLAALLRIRMRHQRTLQKAAETLETHARVIHTVREGVLLANDQGIIEYANPALLTLLCAPGETLVGRPLTSIGIDAQLLGQQSLDEPGGLPSGGHEIHWRDATGAPLALLLTRSTLNRADRTLHVYVLQNVTELRRLEREVLEVASREREQLSSDVHEGLSQDLSGITMLLKSIAGPGKFDGQALGMTIEHLNEAVGKARSLARGLSAVQVARGELGTALEQLGADVSRTWSVQVTCRVALDGLELAPTPADHLYRIAFDRLMGAVRRPGCLWIVIGVGISEETLILTIADDGASPGEVRTAREDLALRTIAYRARVLGGAARVERVGKTGTRITVSVPVANLRHDADVIELATPTAARVAIDER